MGNKIEEGYYTFNDYETIDDFDHGIGERYRFIDEGQTWIITIHHTSRTVSIIEETHSL